MNHTPQCAGYQLTSAMQARAWWLLHPKACRSCGGFGGRIDHGTWWDPPEFTECGDCLDQCRCPICAGPIDLDSEELKCSVCPWRFETSEEAPEVFRCEGECQEGLNEYGEHDCPGCLEVANRLTGYES